MFAWLLLLGIQIAAASPETPNRQPQLAARGDKVGVAYGAGNAIYFAASSDRGLTFGAPVLVSAQGQLSLGMHRGPRIAFTPRGIAITAIAGEQGKGKDGDVLAWHSKDGGASWSKPVRVNDVSGSAREGLHAMASGGKDSLFAAWLDLRGKGTQIYGAISIDGGGTWSPNRLVYESPSGTVCQCCHPSVGIDSKGAIHVMFRNAIGGSRDLYTTRSDDGARSFGPARRQGSGTWKLEGCPMDGGTVAVDDNGFVTSIWRRDQGVFVASGEGAEKELGPGRNPAAVTTRDGLFGAWTQGTSVILSRPGAAQPEIVETQGAFPSLAALPDGSVALAWESKGAVVVRVFR